MLVMDDGRQETQAQKSLIGGSYVLWDVLVILGHSSCGDSGFPTKKSLEHVSADITCLEDGTCDGRSEMAFWLLHQEISSAPFPSFRSVFHRLSRRTGSVIYMCGTFHLKRTLLVRSVLLNALSIVVAIPTTFLSNARGVNLSSTFPLS